MRWKSFIGVRARRERVNCWWSEPARSGGAGVNLFGPHSRLLADRLDRVGTWLSLVEHSLGVRGVGSSNLPVPTIIRINDLERLPSSEEL